MSLNICEWKTGMNREGRRGLYCVTSDLVDVRVLSVAPPVFLQEASPSSGSSSSSRSEILYWGLIQKVSARRQQCIMGYVVCREGGMCRSGFRCTYM